MAALKGSKNALGNRGGGRKSHYQEKADAEALAKMFFGDLDQETLERRIAKGRFSIKDRYLLTALEGDSVILSTIFRKLFPDKTKLSGDKDEPVVFEALEVRFKDESRNRE